MRQKQFPNLYSPLKIGPVTMKNRIESAPMSMTELGPNQGLAEENIAFYRELAKGGAAVVTVGESIVRTDCGKTHPQMLMLGESVVLPSLVEAADAIHEFGALANIEISHGGQMADPAYNNGVDSIGPVEHIDEYGDLIRGMTEEMMEDVADAFAEAADTVKSCGFDMCMIHAGHGWLLSQFLSPKYNTRSDSYGGSRENRIRFPKMVVERVRQRVGRGFALELRISGDEFIEGGATIEDAIYFVQQVEHLIDVVNVSAGAPWTRRMIPSMFDERGFNAYLAIELKKHVGIPVTTVGGFQYPSHMERLLRENAVDGFLIGHGLVADPALPRKGLQNAEDEIVPCLRCRVCNQLMYSNRAFKCAVNPRLGRYSRQYNLTPPAQKKLVLIAGGGPGGMQAAVTAAERGHEVILCEKENQLGGALKFADHISFKKDTQAYRDYLIRMVKRGRIKVMLGTEVTPALVEQIAPDAVIAAVGASPIVPPIPGIDGANVVQAAHMFDEGVQIGDRVVVIGGGLVGCEDGLQLAMDGKKVSIVEMMDEVAVDAPPNHKKNLLPRLYEHVTVYTAARCTEVTQGGVWCETPEGKRFLEADTVVLAAGSRACMDTVDTLRDTADEFWAIGDCVKAGKIMEAVRSGYDAAMNL